MWGIEAAKSLKELSILTANAVRNLFNSISTNSKDIATTQALISTLLPSGTILQFGGDFSPEGYLLCDGSAVSRSEYSRLFNTIGTLYGSGDGSTTFNLPNFQGLVPRGAGTQQIDGRDKIGGSIGTVLEDQMQRITGSTQQVAQRNTATSSGAISNTTVNDLGGSGTSSATRNLYNIGFDSANSPNARVSSATDGETRVSSIAINFIIKV